MIFSLLKYLYLELYLLILFHMRILFTGLFFSAVVGVMGMNFAQADHHQCSGSHLSNHNSWSSSRSYSPSYSSPYASRSYNTRSYRPSYSRSYSQPYSRPTTRNNRYVSRTNRYSCSSGYRYSASKDSCIRNSNVYSRNYTNWY